jgi:hypothetical protein
MSRVLLSIALLLACFAPAVCRADAVNGVLAEERVVNLPQDSAKWYVSVVGNTNDAKYKTILGWFDGVPSLKKLKVQVHFCPVTTDTAIFKERYAPNTKALPMVRMQNAEGVVVYQVCGNDIPMTGQGLNGALANAVASAQGIRPILPWRKEMERRCPGPCPGPGPCPNPNPQPTPQPDPEPAPIDDGGAPNVDPVEPEGPADWLLVPFCGVGFLTGLGIGAGKKLKEKLTQK